MAVKSEMKCGVARRKSSQSVTFCIKEERNASYKKVSSILQKAEVDRTDEEKEVLFSCSELVKEVTRRIEKRKKVKERLQEIEDPPDLLVEKCSKLAEAVANSTNLVVYTGAGVSTAACIPDYRGTNGIWTLLQQGKDIGLHDLTQAEPTITHMALWQLYRAGKLKHVVSQNCDGLHLRSGLPKRALSEVHGNMYVEVCCQCKPTREYWRLFDVTEHTARFSHRTMRRCYTCMGPLVDTIVHFGERGKLHWPLNWSTACQAADKADVILCIGSSLKVLKKYPWLWGMDKPAKKRPKLYIVNLQWTPKDDHAILKISGKCDEVMQHVMSQLKLQIPHYIRSQDPIFSHATILHSAEMHTATQPLLKQPLAFKQESCPNCRGSYVKEPCDCSDNSRAVKIEVSDVTGSYSGACTDICPKIELGDCSKEDIVTEELQMLKSKERISHNSGYLSFLTNDTDNLANQNSCALDKNVKDPFGIMKEQVVKNSTMTVLLSENCFQNQSENLESSSFHPYLSCNESVTSTIGLKMDLDTSFDSNPNPDQGNCDQNSLHINDIILECSTSLNRQKDSHLIGSKYESGSSINSRGCDSGTSSSEGTNYFLKNCFDEPLSPFSISALSLQSLTRILQIEHNYSRNPSSHRMNKEGRHTEEKNRKLKNVKGSMFPTESTSEGSQCKRLKTNRTKMQDVDSFSHLPQSTSPQSTKKFTGKQKTKDEEKQICDEKYDYGDTTMCSFCKSNYSSNSCLFYPQWTSKFENIPLRSRVSICECCDTDEEDDADDVVVETCKTEDGDAHDNSESKGNSDDTSKAAKVPNVNPGWYGKGYRKRTKRKRLEKL